ncbi:hypothetical protein AVEN_21424-1 [Araneus ventricosus]|uniref:DUF4371 domain-containing protein n=1 Tax=Araneus ventricosus TaxID=182803 RepID=A0A4Y2W5X5_ARAVE|nr:hypothetical protein AVEN_21424-1 [Araneus ventricosus]
MGKTEKNAIISTLKKVPFSIAIDGRNKGVFKLYPLVVTFHKEETQKIESSLLSGSALERDSTGVNIASLILNELKSNNIPLENCLALSADNAPVMIEKKFAVASILSTDIKHLIFIGCPCHLFDLAAEKCTSCSPTSIEDFLNDIYFYLEKSSKRKEKLKMFQSMYDAGRRKLLKHV